MKKSAFAFPAHEVQELIVGRDVMPVPDTPPYVRGVINLRGRVFPVVDLRKRLGIDSLAEENAAFCALMEQRRQDHVNWVSELEASVRESRRFSLATDPHRCAFGLWYDHYKPENVWIANLLHRFVEPHLKIHQTAGRASALQAQGDWEGALSLIEQTRKGVLRKMIELFSELAQLIVDSTQEVVVLLQTQHKTLAVSVDEAVAIEKFAAQKMGDLPHTVGGGLATQFGIRDGSGSLVLMLATERIG
ncbi:MAG: chemotaxis protein CheW [Bryobacteraceae bacterium]